MGTNYYRIPKHEEMVIRKEKLIKDVESLVLTPQNIGVRFNKNFEYQWETETPWDTFINDTKIHLGKRSGGWKFCWNFHNNKYYSNKEELLEFIRSGRVINEYCDEIDNEEFIKMALNWGQPNGLVFDVNYRKNNKEGLYWDNPKYDDLIIDGLRVSRSTEFS